MKLSDRLEGVAALISEGIPVVDVGTDHAYLPVSLVLRGKTPCALASDLRKGPLERAIQNIREAGLSDKVRTVLCDGVPPMNELHESLRGGALVIAGMGGPLMASILENAADRLDFFSEIIAEPQSDLGTFRKMLIALGYEIVDENMIKEDGKYYPIIKAVKMAEARELSEMELAFGPCLIARKNPVLMEFVLKQHDVNRRLQSQMTGTEGEKARIRLAELIKEQNLLESVLTQIKQG